MGNDGLDFLQATQATDVWKSGVHEEDEGMQQFAVGEEINQTRWLHSLETSAYNLRTLLEMSHW